MVTRWQTQAMWQAAVSIVATVSVLVVIVAGMMGAFLLLSRAMQNGVGVGPLQPRSGPCVRHLQCVSPLPPAQVHAAVQRGLFAVGARITWVEPWRVCAVRGSNFKSWGEVLTVWLYPYRDGTALLIESKPLLFTTLIDWGQGSTNVRGLMTSLAAERIVQPQPA